MALEDTIESFYIGRNNFIKYNLVIDITIDRTQRQHTMNSIKHNTQSLDK